MKATFMVSLSMLFCIQLLIMICGVSHWTLMVSFLLFVGTIVFLVNTGNTESWEEKDTADGSNPELAMFLALVSLLMLLLLPYGVGLVSIIPIVLAICCTVK